MKRLRAPCMLATLLAWTLPVAGSAESPVGQWQIDFATPDLLSVVPESFEDCENVGIPGVVGSACWSFAPGVDASGNATGTLSVEYDTDVITGTLSATMFGRFRGRSGEGDVGSTQARLGIDFSGDLHFVPFDLDVDTDVSTRCSGTIPHLPDPAELQCKVKVCVEFEYPQLPGHTVHECGSAETSLVLLPSLDEGDWSLALDLSDDGTGVLTGTGTATFRGETVDFAVTGKYSATTDSASLSLKPLVKNGSAIKIKGLTVSGGQITGGEVGYKLFGHKGKTSLAP